MDKEDQKYGSDYIGDMISSMAYSILIGITQLKLCILLVWRGVTEQQLMLVWILLQPVGSVCTLPRAV